MVQIEYYKLEQRDNRSANKTRFVYRLKHKEFIPGERFIKDVAHRRGFDEATITGVLIDVAKELAEQLGNGNTVELPGIGIFTVGVKMKDDDAKAGEMEVAEVPAEDSSEAQTKAAAEKNARNLQLDHINYRKNKTFFREVESHFRRQEISRAYGKVGRRIKTSQYPQLKNRMIVAREFLQDHPFMTVQDYADITGLSYSSAQRELKASWHDPQYGITIEGRGSHRVYVLRQAESQEE